MQCPNSKRMENSWLFFLKNAFTGIKHIILWSADITSNVILPLTFSTGATTESLPKTFKRSTGKTWGPLRVGGCFPLTFTKTSSAPACLWTMRRCSSHTVTNSHHVSHWELQHYYPLWKWAMSVFGINWFSLVVDIFHLLSWERAEWVCSSRVLKVEEKILIWGGSRSLSV